MKFEFKYDEIADVLFIKSEGMDRKTEIIDGPNMKRLYLDRFTKKIVGARLTGFMASLDEEIHAKKAG